jgi:hypothetical protein
VKQSVTAKARKEGEREREEKNVMTEELVDDGLK